MNTISLNRTMNVAFKQVQLLPVLTAEMLAGERSSRNLRPMPARPETRPAGRVTTAPASDPALPRPRTDRSLGEGALLAVLASSALFCVGQAFAPVAHVAPNWPAFTAWLAQWL